MAIWSKCSGTYTIEYNSKFSLRKFVAALYDEVSWQYITQETTSAGTLKVNFEFVFALDGLEAAKLVDCLVAKLIAAPGYRSSNIKAEIRFT